MCDIRDSKLKVMITRGGKNSLKCSEIEIDKLCNPEWRNKTGGRNEVQGYYFLSAQIPYEIAPLYVDCSSLHDGEYATVKVCTPTRSEENYEIHKAGYAELANQAGPKPESTIASNRPNGMPPCTTQMKRELESGSMTRHDLRTRLLGYGYKSSTILTAIRSLTKKELISLEGSSHSPHQIIRLK